MIALGLFAELGALGCKLSQFDSKGSIVLPLTPHQVFIRID